MLSLRLQCPRDLSRCLYRKLLRLFLLTLFRTSLFVTLADLLVPKESVSFFITFVIVQVSALESTRCNFNYNEISFDFYTITNFKNWLHPSPLLRMNSTWQFANASPMEYWFLHKGAKYLINDGSKFQVRYSSFFWIFKLMGFDVP